MKRQINNNGPPTSFVVQQAAHLQGASTSKMNHYASSLLGNNAAVIPVTSFSVKSSIMKKKQQPTTTTSSSSSMMIAMDKDAIQITDAALLKRDNSLLNLTTQENLGQKPQSMLVSILKPNPLLYRTNGKRLNTELKDDVELDDVDFFDNKDDDDDFNALEQETRFQTHHFELEDHQVLFRQ
jgi:hypothetical protein